ncbi:putative MFS family arabinose efflux permease [Pseudomonas lini]|uniref:MFS transporter n=1 Tax=Pseudomonas lini TaxID=163011 RepID=UPI002789DFB8|nr:MFS transporter [Pseudomonas lini]MDQ0122052.1 putative MFS family arabinose efflux permease [Pseudomonas lini]
MTQTVLVDSNTTSALTPAPAPWSAVAAIGIGAFALVTAEFLPVGLLPQIANDLAITQGQAGLMITIPGVVAACSALLTIGLTNAFDRSHVLWVLLSLLVVSNSLIACANGLPLLLLGRVVLGVAVGGFWTIGVSLGARLRPDAVGKATSIVFSGVTLGTVAGVPAGTMLGALFGWRMSFAVSAVLAALLVLALVRLLPAIRPEPSSGLTHVPSVLKIPNVQLGLVAVALIFTGQFCAYTYFAAYLGEVSGVEPSALSALLLTYGIAGILGNLFCGWWVGRNLRLAVLSTSLVLGCSMLLLAAIGKNPAAVTLAVVMWGFGFGMLPIAIQSWIFNAAPNHLESAAALFVSMGQLFMGAGALVGGITVDNYGLTSAVWVGAAGTLCGSLWIIARFFSGTPVLLSQP